jgi:HAD superfamily hydrolase (TIGR01549 family)
MTAAEASTLLRPARPFDALRLAAIRRESILVLARSHLGDRDAQSWADSSRDDRVRRAIAEHKVWLAELDGAVIGWVEVHRERIEALYVHPDFAGRGVGSRLLTHAESLIREEGHGQARLEASRNAENFYLRRGYEPRSEAVADLGRLMLKELSPKRPVRPALTHPAALLIDIGGTLLREQAYDLPAGVRSLEPHRGLDVLTRDLLESIDRTHATNSAEFTVAQWLGRNRDYFLGGSTVHELEDALWKATVKLSPMPGVKQTLFGLRDLGLRIGCISNAVFSGRVLDSELKRHGLDVDFVISSADLGIRKPDPRIFSAGLARMSLSASAAWFVGDSWTADICGAAGAGIFPIWLTEQKEPAPPAPPCSRVASWTQILRLVSGSTIS